MSQRTSADVFRRRFSSVMALGVVACVAGFFLPGLPVMRPPSASAVAIAEGRMLFEHVWLPGDPLSNGGDGLGPVFNDRSCVACHFQGGVGGGGGNRHNVITFDIRPNRRDGTETISGVIHANAVQSTNRESVALVRRLFPVVKGGVQVQNGCSIRTADFDPVRITPINTPTLFGAGWLDRISEQSLVHNHRMRLLSESAKEWQLNFNGINPGRLHRLPDGRIGRFGWKAQFATLEEFVASACAMELGLSNEARTQPTPLGKQPPSALPAPDMSMEQIASLTAFVATLPRPTTGLGPRVNAALRDRGEAVFHEIGCAACHTPDIGGVAGVYSDFCLHRVDVPEGGSGNGSYGDDFPEVPPDDSLPLPDEWKTPPLWGVADTAPYFHDGGSPTLHDAIVRHRGSANGVRKMYQNLLEHDRKALLAFLESLVSPPPADLVAHRLP